VIGSTTKQVSSARSRTVYFLALFLASSVVYGLSYVQGWLFFALGIAIFGLAAYHSWKIQSPRELGIAVSITDVLFLLMIFCSALSLIYPIQVKDGLIEIIRWGILWFVFRLSTTISGDELAKQLLTLWIERIGAVVAVVGWLPWVTKIDGRLSSVFGYSNALAAFIGAVLLLHPRRKMVRVFLGISLIATGSRAGVGLFIVLYLSRQSLYWIDRWHQYSSGKQRRKKRWTLFKRIFDRNRIIYLGVTGFVLIAIWYRPAWKNLTTWGFSSTSWLERLDYYQDGLTMAWKIHGFPRAGGWMAFPTVQNIPYWTSDPHSSIIHILMNQGIYGVVCAAIWCSLIFYGYWRNSEKKSKKPKYLKELQKDFVDDRVLLALVFLALHSLVDADFSFGALGLLFWILFGSLRINSLEILSFSLKRNTFRFKVLDQGIIMIYLSVALFSGYALFSPSFLDREKTWNEMALREQDPEKRMILWERSLNWDHTQITVVRAQAELLLRHGNMDVGLERVEEVLCWQPLDLEAYEWAQSLVWETAETRRPTDLKSANKLYQWVETVPQRIEERAARLNDRGRSFWKGQDKFRPSQHIQLLAEYAHQREFTQPPVKT
jgi:hypothetical protein